MHPVQKLRVLFLVVGVSFAGNAMAQKPIVYPSKGQSVAQQKQDEGECYVWAKDNTGVDPTQPTTRTGSRPGGERLRGAARGAAAGAVIGEIANDDAGRGAGTGAAIGTMRGGAQARRNQAAREQTTSDTYTRAYAACMEGRGYTVK